MKHQLEFSETEILNFAERELKNQGKVPRRAPTYRYRSTDPDDKGEYTFTIRWDSAYDDWEKVLADPNYDHGGAVPS